METDFSASLGDDEIVGSSQADEIDGLAGNDKLKGQAGDDILSGGPGNDTLEGGIGNDVLHGGAGFNTAVFYGAPTEYDRIRNDDNTYTVAARPGSDAHAAGYGSDVLHNIQDLQFLVFNEVIDDFQIISSSLDDVSDIADVELPDIGFGNNATFFTNYEGDADYFRVNIPTDGTYVIFTKTSDFGAIKGLFDANFDIVNRSATELIYQPDYSGHQYSAAFYQSIYADLTAGDYFVKGGQQQFQ